MKKVRLPMSDELKVAIKLSDVVSDVRLDLELIGTYLAEVAPSVSFRRLQEIANAAEYEKGKQNEFNRQQ